VGRTGCVVSAPTLASLLLGLHGAELVRGSAEVVIAGVEHDSRSVVASSLFVAVPGLTVDGHAYLVDALEAGAAAVVVERGRRGAWRHLPGDAPIVAVDDARTALAQAAAAFYGHPSRELTVIGVTGTDGKTTTTHLLTAVLEAAGARVGRLGTVDAYVPGTDITGHTARMTTPEAPQLQRLLREMVDAGCAYAIIEATSHGLALGRLDEIAFDVAAFTNVTSDHLDFHKSVEAYRAAKGALFAALDQSPAREGGPPKAAIANADDPSSGFMPAQTSARAIRYGIEATDVDVSARDIELRPDGSRFRLVVPGAEVAAEIHLPALFNVSNALAAAAVAVAVGIEPHAIARGLAACPGVPGRMESINAAQPFDVVVDYAHTGEAVRKVLEVLRGVTGGRLIIVVGAAGERDPGRRAGVGRAAAEGADFAVFTSEDPRSEDPETIVAEIGRHAQDAGGIRGRDFVEVVERREAITTALTRAAPGDLVVICGKGHERSIEMGDRTIPWDDRDVTREELAKLGHTGA